MKTIQIVVDEPLLRAADREVRRRKTSRSELFRRAVKDLLARRAVEEAEEQERRAYRARPPTEFDVWDRVLAWPED